MDISSYFHLACVAFCVLHSIFSWINSIRLNKKISRVCEKCFSPIYSGEEHNCFSSALESFVRGDNNG